MVLFLLGYCYFCCPTAVAFVYHSHLSSALSKLNQRCSLLTLMQHQLLLVNALLKKFIFHRTHVFGGALTSLMTFIFCFMSRTLKSSIKKGIAFSVFPYFCIPYNLHQWAAECFPQSKTFAYSHLITLTLLLRRSPLQSGLLEGSINVKFRHRSTAFAACQTIPLCLSCLQFSSWHPEPTQIGRALLCRELFELTSSPCYASASSDKWF